MEGLISTELPATPAQAALDVLVVLLAFAGVVLLVAAVRLIRIRLRDRREQSRELPPLIYPVRGLEEQRAAMTAANHPGLPSGEQVLFNSTAPVAPPLHLVREAAGSARESHEAGVGNGGEAGSRDAAEDAGSRDAAEDDAADVDAVDTEATLQLLPGRLEPADRGTDQEIRFVRAAGVNRFTLGRSASETHSHIQLRAATASRMHAYMVFEDGCWRVGNMSQTNAVVVNGSPLNGDPHQLTEGDRVEFGELTFVFRER